MTPKSLMFIANHPFVRLSFCDNATHCWAFARYFCALLAQQFLAMEVQHRELLDLREAVTRYQMSSYREIARDMPDLEEIIEWYAHQWKRRMRHR